MKTLSTFTVKDTESWGSFYPDEGSLPDGWSGTIIDALNMEDLFPGYRLWLACRTQFFDAHTLRDFAVWCASIADRYVDSHLVSRVYAAARQIDDGVVSDEELRTLQSDLFEVYKRQAETASGHATLAFSRTLMPDPGEAAHHVAMSLRNLYGVAVYTLLIDKLFSVILNESSEEQLLEHFYSKRLREAEVEIDRLKKDLEHANTEWAGWKAEAEKRGEEIERLRKQEEG